jgi:hypothetical protein
MSFSSFLSIQLHIELLTDVQERLLASLHVLNRTAISSSLVDTDPTSQRTSSNMHESVQKNEVRCQALWVTQHLAMIKEVVDGLWLAHSVSVGHLHHAP